MFAGRVTEAAEEMVTASLGLEMSNISRADWSFHLIISPFRHVALGMKMKTKKKDGDEPNVSARTTEINLYKELFSRFSGILSPNMLTFDDSFFYKSKSKKVDPVIYVTTSLAGNPSGSSAPNMTGSLITSFEGKDRKMFQTEGCVCCWLLQPRHSHSQAWTFHRFDQVDKTQVYQQGSLPPKGALTWAPQSCLYPRS